MIPIEAGAPTTIPTKEPEAPSKPSPSYVEKQVAHYTAIEEQIRAGVTPYPYQIQAPTTTTPPSPIPSIIAYSAETLHPIIPSPAYHYTPPAFPSHYAHEPYYSTFKPLKYGAGYGKGLRLPLPKWQYEKLKEKQKRALEEAQPEFYLKFHGSPSFEIKTSYLAIATALIIAVLVILVLR